MSVEIALQDLRRAADELPYRSLALDSAIGYLVQELNSSEYVPSEFKEALHLLEACRGCDLVYEAWPAFGSGNVVHGVTITDQTNISDVVDAFLKRHISGESK